MDIDKLKKDVKEICDKCGIPTTIKIKNNLEEKHE